MKKTVKVVGMIVLVFFLSACQESEPMEPATPAPEEAVAESMEQGDGSLTLGLRVTGEEPQALYRLVFSTEGRFQPEPTKTAVGDVMMAPALDTSGKIRSVIAYEVTAGEPLQLSIESLSSVLYAGAIGEPLKAQVGVFRMEDEYCRNPLNEPLLLVFSDDMMTCEQGSEIELAIADEPLIAMYPEGTFLLKIDQPSLDDHAGYPQFTQRSPEGKVTASLGRGSGGPDFLVAFSKDDLSRFAGAGPVELTVTDYENRVRTDPMMLEFDGNGDCLQGQFQIIEVKPST